MLSWHPIPVILITISITFLNLSADAQQQFSKQSVVVAHRGAWKQNRLPENSLASLRQAINQKLAGSEFDVRMTSDDSLIISHDPKYNELSIENSTYANLTTFRLSNGEQLPTLRAYILCGLADNQSTSLVCEIKPSELSKERGKVIAAKVIQLVNSLNAQSKVIYISFDYEVLRFLTGLYPKLPIQYLMGDKSPSELKADGIYGADYHLSVFKNHPEWIESARINHIILNAWTVNEAEDMDWLLANGFDFITTNEPELLSEKMKQSPVYNGMKLIWADEFNTDGPPDPAKWDYDLGTGSWGWGNNELEYYTNRSENVRIQDGLLKIKAIRENYTGSTFTSSRIKTQHKFDFKYGKVEVRAKLPQGAGTWPAIWMLGSDIAQNGWPACGEIDIMEHKGNDLNKIFGTLHYPGRSGGNANEGTRMIPDVTNSFHKYSLEWSPSVIRILADDQVINSAPNSESIPFNHNFFLILNLAMGGTFGGSVGAEVNGATMDVDYVRVYQ